MNPYNRKIKFPIQNKTLEFEIDGQNITIDLHHSLKVTKGMLNKIFHFVLAVHSLNSNDKYFYISEFTKEIQQIKTHTNYVEMMEMEEVEETF